MKLILKAEDDYFDYSLSYNDDNYLRKRQMRKYIRQFILSKFLKEGRYIEFIPISQKNIYDFTTKEDNTIIVYIDNRMFFTYHFVFSKNKKQSVFGLHNGICFVAEENEMLDETFDYMIRRNENMKGFHRLPIIKTEHHKWKEGEQ